MRTDQIKYGSYTNILQNSQCLLPSAYLCAAFCDLFKVKYPKVFSVFSENIYPYKRVDLNTTAIPALMIYPSSSRFVGESWYGKSYLNFDFIFPGGAMIRQRSTEIAQVISETVIYLILKNDNVLEWLKFGLPDDDGNPTWGPFPGLVEIGERVDCDYNNINALVKEQDSVRMTLKVSYTIDTVQWWNYIQEVLGNNIFNPNEFLYPLIQGYLVDVNLQSSQG